MASSSTSHEVSTSGAEDTTGLRACVLVPSREGWERISNRILATNEPEQVVAGYLLPTGLPDGSTQQQGFLQTFTKDQVELLAFHKLDQFLTPYYPEIPRTGAHVFAGMGLMNVFADGTNPNKVGMVVRAAELLKDWEPLVDLYLKSRIGELNAVPPTPTQMMDATRPHLPLPSQPANVPGPSAKHVKVGNGLMFVKESYLRCLELENRMYRKHLIHFEEARNKDLEDVLLAGDEEFKDLEGYAELKAEVEKERADKALAATLDLQTLLRNEREKGRAEGRQMALDEAEKKKRRSRRTDDEKDEDYQPVAKRARKPKAKQAGGRHAQVGPAGAETVGGDTAVAGTNVGGDDGSGPAEIRDTM